MIISCPSCGTRNLLDDDGPADFTMICYRCEHQWRVGGHDTHASKAIAATTPGRKAPEVLRAVELVEKFVAVFAGIVILVISLAILAQFVSRLTGAVILGIEDIVDLTFPLVLLAVAFAMATGRSVGSRLAFGWPRVQAVFVGLINTFLFLPILTVLVYSLTETLQQKIGFDERTMGLLALPSWPATALINVALVLLGLQILVEIGRSLSCIIYGEWPERHPSVWWTGPATGARGRE